MKRGQVFTFAGTNAPRAGMTISETLAAALEALRAAGAKEGDSVVIGDMEFDFVE